MQSIYTADPAPLVHEGAVYLYTGHDEDNALDNRYLMYDYRCYLTTDMVNWTDHGAVLDIRKVFKWSGGDANVAQCIYRNGKFYYYVSTGNTKGPGEIVATDNGDPTEMTSSRSSNRRAFNGLALAIVRAKNGQTGSITVSVKAEGLTAAAVTINLE